MNDRSFTWERFPKEPGWYVIEYSWDSTEGTFRKEAYFNGDKWDRRRPIHGYTGPFDSEYFAKEWADENYCEY